MFSILILFLETLHPYGNKDDLYDRLKRHAYGKKGTVLLILCFLYEHDYLFVYHFVTGHGIV